MDSQAVKGMEKPTVKLCADALTTMEDTMGFLGMEPEDGEAGMQTMNNIVLIINAASAYIEKQAGRHFGSHVGMRARDYIIGYMMDADNFDKKGSIVRSTSNWPDNPLVETGRLRNSITYAIMEG